MLGRCGGFSHTLICRQSQSSGLMPSASPLAQHPPTAQSQGLGPQVKLRIHSHGLAWALCSCHPP